MATSKCFVATLPTTLTDDQFDKLRPWSQYHCEQSDFARDKKNGCIRLLVTKREPRTQRDFQRLLRTIDFGVTMPTKQVGWLRIFDMCDCDRMRILAAGDEAAENTESSTRSAPVAPVKSLLRLPVSLLKIKST